GAAASQWHSIWAAGCCCASNTTTRRDTADSAGCPSSAAASRTAGTRCAVRYIARDPSPATTLARTRRSHKTQRMNAPDADAPLIERVKRGDVKAFEMLVVKYQRRIERLIGRMVRDVDLIPDIAQETFIRAYRAIPQFRGESAFYTWLYRIA